MKRRGGARPAFLETRGGEGWSYLMRGAAKDLASGFADRKSWRFLAWREVRRQYERSLLGPFWITLNIGMLVAALGWFYSEIFVQDIATYLPYLTLGFIIFGFISGMVTEASNVFSAAGASIKQSQLPLSFYVFKMIFRQMIVLAHNFTVFLLVAVTFAIPVGPEVLLAIPGFILMVATGFFLSLIVGPISARFRDIPPILASLMQVVFFLTPVFWTPQHLPQRGLFLQANPFYHYLELVRQPLLGNAPAGSSWVIATAVTLVLGLCSFLVFSRLRARIAYWV